MKPVLVLGGGISGVTAAVEMAEAGREVVLVEKEPWLGGNVLKMHNYFPKLCPPACGMEINFRRIRNNKRIIVKTGTEVISMSGEQGHMTVQLRTRPQLVNDFCTACGECVEVCPEQRPDQLNNGYGTTKAIYRTHELSFPQKFEIDTEYCAGTSCSKCVDACRYDAIDLNAQVVDENLEVHSVITATGWKSYDPETISGLNYTASKDIVKNMEFERLLSVAGPGEGKLKRPSDAKAPRSVAFVQCAGSRDRNYLPYCSAVCCSASMKHALNTVEIVKDADVTIYYIDLRVTGRNEDFLARVEQTNNISLVKGKVAAITPMEDGTLTVAAEDIGSGKKVKKNYDMVVLATGIVPANNVPGLNKNPEGFYNGIQPSGIYVAGCASKPQDVSSCVKDATGAALMAMQKQRGSEQ